MFPLVSAASLSLDPVRLAAGMVLNWGWSGALSENEVGTLDLWGSTTGPLDLNCVSCLQPWYYLCPMAPEGRHPLVYVIPLLAPSVGTACLPQALCSGYQWALPT